MDDDTWYITKCATLDVAMETARDVLVRETRRTTIDRLFPDIEGTSVNMAWSMTGDSTRETIGAILDE